MKTKYSLTLLALFVAAVAFGQLFKTSLTLTVRDGVGNTVSDAEVQLFEKKEDYEKEVNAVFTGKTDKKGVAKFKNLKAIRYYLLVKKGDIDNAGGGEEIGKLEDGKFNKATVVIQ
jgi:hypothetical protein